ncbi:hypothetical protein IFT48_04395 [Pseudomonas fluorescens]|nr:MULTISPECIES: hypothetical protein [Pseudomonas]MBD8089212.1 hypothetical protein [Pseudomonas fluorescens]MBD8615361.1 hypothetical protein [Pseudomonas putida]MBD8681985.1 hypothetical protein [Pseudomonas sp. CFBP 13719]
MSEKITTTHTPPSDQSWVRANPELALIFAIPSFLLVMALLVYYAL